MTTKTKANKISGLLTLCRDLIRPAWKPSRKLLAQLNGKAGER